MRIADGPGIGIEPEAAAHLRELPFHGEVTPKEVGNAVGHLRTPPQREGPPA